MHAVALEAFAERGYHGTSVPQILEAAGVSASSLYRLFPSKEALVNAVFLEAKTRLGHALAEVEGHDAADADRDPASVAHARFVRIWDRLARFAAEEPVTFRFLELQDHTPYLDGPSRTKELSVLAPLALTCMDLQRRGVLRTDVGVDVMLATLWGALVGLVKASRLGYLALDADKLAEAREALWRGFASTEPIADARTRRATRTNEGTKRRTER
ncbi:MAG: TetR/AcrR family transcriptional regulator; helix-turn-helix transcriptional regulator [Sandaracinaceae bacterium]|nr:TetR/AcrR family transcriptional regulator; helix-turn-helix transcriptional regulator [Sandaracinaceae bacterium]